MLNLIKIVHGAVLVCVPRFLNRLVNHDKTLLSFAAHPDDASWGWGHLLWRKVAAGWTVISVVATRGDAGNGGLIPEIAKIRMEEELASCRHLGVTDVRWLGYTEANILQVPFEELVSRIFNLIVTTRATKVVTYGELGLTRHPHHIHLHHAVTEACRRAAVAVSYVDATPHWDRHVGTVLKAVGAIDPDVQLMTEGGHNYPHPRHLSGKALRAMINSVHAHKTQVEQLDRELSMHGGFPALEANWLYTSA